MANATLKTPKLGQFGSTLYYYQQKYVNWDYVSSSSYDDIIMIDYVADFTSELSGNKIISGPYQTEISMQAFRYITEDGLKNNYVQVDVTVTSTHRAFVHLVDLKNSLPFPSNFQTDIDINLSSTNPTYIKSFQFPFVDLSVFNEEDTLTVRYRLPKPYPSTMMDLKYQIPRENYKSILPYATIFKVVDAVDITKVGSTSTRLSLINSIYIQHTPTNFTAFSINTTYDNTGYYRCIELPGFVSNYKLLYPPCAVSEEFAIVGNNYNIMRSVESFFKTVSFISSVNLG